MVSTYRGGLGSYWAWALPNLLWMLPAHLAATLSWQVLLLAERGGSAGGLLVDTVLWAIFGLYLPILLLVPALVYLAGLWCLASRMPRRMTRRLAVVSAALVISAGFVVLRVPSWLPWPH